MPDLVARLYGFAHWRELSADVGRNGASPVDEESADDIVAARRQRHIDMIRTSFPALSGKAGSIVDGVRPTASRTGNRAPDADRPPPTPAPFPDSLLHLLLGDLDPRVERAQKAAAAILMAHLLGAGIADLGATWTAMLVRGVEDVTLPGAAFYDSVGARSGLFAEATCRPLHFAGAVEELRLWGAFWPFFRSPESILASLDGLSRTAAEGRTLEEIAVALSDRAGASWSKTSYEGTKLARLWRASAKDISDALPAMIAMARDPAGGLHAIQVAAESLAKDEQKSALRTVAKSLIVDQIFQIATGEASPMDCCRQVLRSLGLPDPGPAAEKRWSEAYKVAKSDMDSALRRVASAKPAALTGIDLRSTGLPKSFWKAAKSGGWDGSAKNVPMETFLARTLAGADLDAFGWEFNDEFYPVDAFLGAHRRGLSLMDLGTTWLKKFSEAARQAPDEDDKLAVEPAKLLSMATEGVGFDGNYDADLAEYLENSELCWPWKFRSFLAGDSEGTDINGALRRLADAHAAGLTLEHLARAAWDIADAAGDFEDYKNNPDEMREEWSIDELRTALAEDAETAGKGSPESLAPDYDDPFAVRPKDVKRIVECLHCGGSYPAGEIVYERRFGLAMWWCKNKTCDGAGLGFDLHFAASWS